MDSELLECIIEIRDELNMTPFQIGDIVLCTVFAVTAADAFYSSIHSVTKQDTGLFYLILLPVEQGQGYLLPDLNIIPSNIFDLDQDSYYIWVEKPLISL